jgi:hypothetical protein
MPAGAVFSRKVYGLYLFADPTVAGINYLDMLQLFLILQLEEYNGDLIVEQDGAFPHLYLDIRAHLSVSFPGRWIGRATVSESLLSWPPRSPDLTVRDFSYGVIGGIVCMCPLCHTIYHSYHERS